MQLCERQAGCIYCEVLEEVVVVVTDKLRSVKQGNEHRLLLDTTSGEQIGLQHKILV